MGKVEKFFKHQEKKTMIFLGAIVLVAILISSGIFLSSKQKNEKTGKTQEEQLESIQKQKVEELENLGDMYDENNIVLSNTNKEQAELIAEKIGARVRTTKDGEYAVLYLPEGVSIEDVYKNEEYRAYLPEMEPDHYVSAKAVNANNVELHSGRPEYTVDDIDYTNQTYLDYINMRDVWNVSKGKSVNVAIIDTGIDTDNKEFSGKISKKSYNASEDKTVLDYGMTVIEDKQGHGTEVAGVLAATMNNKNGIVGISPEVNLIIVKCEASKDGQFASSDLVFGLAYAIEANADVINMSFGCPLNVFSKYTKLAVDDDIICVASAGNEGSSLPSYPAADENVIGVGSIDTESWSLAPYSNFGDNIDVLAPGTVYTTKIDGKFGYTIGTSLASPMVAGAVALYQSMHPHTKYTEICELLKASSVDLGILGSDWYNGFGSLDMYAFLCEEKGTITYDMMTDEVKNQTQVFVKGHTIQYMPEPERENVVFDGWFFDKECTDECEYYSEIFTDNITLYASWINEDEGEAYIYTTKDDGSVEINSYTGKRRYVTVPDTIEGKTVTSIGAEAFLGNDRIRSVTLPNTVTYIGDRAFKECHNIRSIAIPEKVVSIGNQAFYDCIRLSQVATAQNGALTTIGSEAFSMCSISSFQLPAKVNSIGEGVFYGDTSMRDITVALGNSNYKIINQALYNSDGTTLLYYPSGLTGQYTVDLATKKIGDRAFAYSRASEVELNNGITEVGEYGFANSSLKSINIPSTVISLGGDVCNYCTSLTKVVFGDNMKCNSIPIGAFSCCSSLKEILIPAGIEKIEEDAFSSSGLQKIQFGSNSKLKEIGACAFWCNPFSSIQIPDTVEVISDNAFENCSELIDVSFGTASRCREIGNAAFVNCKSLEKFTLPDATVRLGERAFFDSGLKKIEIGAGLIEIGNGAFSSCQNFSSFDVDSGNTVYAVYDDVLFNKDKTVLMMYPAAKSGEYRLPDTTVRVEDYAFAGARKLSEIRFNEGLEEIGQYTFSKCISLQTPAYPQSLITIGSNAFEYCSAMTGTMMIPKKVINIGRFAFYQDYNLTNIQIAPETELSRIGYGSFAYCGIEDFTVPGNVQTMGQEVFTGCKNLIAVTYEADSMLESLAAWTFDGADNLRQITFEENSELSEIEARALEGLTMLEQINIENCKKLKAIGNYAFRSCISLGSINFPSSLQTIGRYAFSNCKKISRMDLPKAIDFIGQYAFIETNGMSIYFKTAMLPLNLEENWNYDIDGYYLGVDDIKNSGDWTYALTEDNKASVISYNGSDENVTLTTLDGYEVVSIGGKAFFNNQTLQTISLPDTLTGIYQSAFEGTTALTRIEIPSKVRILDDNAFKGSGIQTIGFASGSQLEILGRYAFANTKNLGEISIPEGVQKIRDYAFYKSNLKNIQFGENAKLEEIGQYSFAKSNLIEISIPNMVREIGYYAFSGSKNLTNVILGNNSNTELGIRGNAFYQTGIKSIDIPANVTYIGELCFTDCENLLSIHVAEDNKNYSSNDGVLFDKKQTKLITCPAGKEGSYSIAKTVVTFGFAAFEHCKLSEIHMPEDGQLLSIGYRTFFQCNELKSIEIPASVHSIESYAFAYCENLESVYISSNSQLNGIYKNAFYNCSKLCDILIPEMLQEIGDYAFYGCTELKNIQFAKNSNLKIIGDHAFEYAGLTDFVMADALLDIGNYAFCGAKLNTLVFNNCVEEIGDYAFADCGLKETTVLTMPESIKSLGRNILRGAEALETLTLPFLGTYVDDPEGKLEMIIGTSNLKTVHILHGTYLGVDAFANYASLREVSLPAELYCIKTEAFFASPIEKIELPEHLAIIEDGAFRYTKIKSINLPESLVEIGDYAFGKCLSLEDITLPKGLKKIGAGAFYQTLISNVEISDTVREIGGGAFSGTENLEKIQVDEKNKYYASFSGILYTKDCKKILSVPGKIAGLIELPEGLETITEGSFKGCKGITNVNLPNSLREIDSYAFAECENLESIIIPENVEYIGTECFSHCVKLRSVDCRNKVGKMEAYIFIDCIELEEIILPEAIEQIPSGCFVGCRGLKYIELPDSLKEIGSIAFSDCEQLKYIKISKNVQKIGDGAFSGCRELMKVEVDADNINYRSMDGILYNYDCTKIIDVPQKISGKIRIPEGVKSLGEGTFKGCCNLTEITLPDSLEEIFDYCFAECQNLEKIHVGKNIKYIGRQILFNSPKIQADSRNWEDGVLYIENCAVQVKTGIKNVRIREGTTILSDCFLRDGDGKDMPIETIVLPDSLKYTSLYSLVDLKNLKSIKLPDNLINAQGCLIGCSNLEYVHMGSQEKKQSCCNFNLSSCDKIKVLCIPYGSGNVLGETTLPSKIVVTTIENMDTEFLNGVDDDTEVYCYVGREKDWPSGWNHNAKTYYKGEWNLSTFYIDGVIVQMDPVKAGDILKVPAENLISSSLSDGKRFLGWDIDGDGKADQLPNTLSDDIEAHAVLTTSILNISMDEEMELEVGKSKQLNVEYYPADYNQDGTLVWTSSDQSVATVDKDGKVTAIAEGSAIITAELSSNPEVAVNCNVTVIPAQYGIYLDETEGELNVGETLKLVPEIAMPDGNMDPISWTSNDAAIATVDNDGLITAIAPGTTVITAKCGLYTANYNITVLRPLEKISWQESEAEANLNLGDTKQLHVVYSPEDTTDDKSVTWYSINPSVATVDSNGLVSVVGGGDAEIVAWVGINKLVYKVHAQAPIQWIKLNTTTGTMRVNRTKQLEVIYNPSNTTDDKAVTWTSSNDAVASVDKSGIVTAKKAGTAVITGRVGQHEATYHVTVVGLKDDKTGITIANSDDTAMPENMSLNITCIDNEAANKEFASSMKNVKETISGDSGRTVDTMIYDISLSENGNLVQPTQTVDVEIPAENYQNINDIAVYRLEEDGSLKNMNAICQDGMLKFETEHFSIYVVGIPTDEIAVQQVSLEQSQITICPESTATLEAKVLPENATNQTLKWSSSDENIAAVDENGMISSIKEGDVKITVSSTDGSNIQEVCTVKVSHSKETILENQKEASCTENGYTGDKMCADCGKLLEQGETIEALGHTVSVKNAKEATCIEIGYTGDKVCTVCGAIVEQGQIIDAKGHSYGEPVIVKEATGSKPGEKAYTCTVCGDVKTEEIPATNIHYYDEGVIAKEPTCLEAGTRLYRCTETDCDASYTEEIPALGHDIVLDEAKEATCTEAGLTGGAHCSRCKEVLTAQESIPARGHIIEVKNIKQSTCTEEGYTGDEICKNCGVLVQKGKAEAALGHKEVKDSAVAPSCVEEGKTEGSHCSVCKEIVKKQEIILALGHSYEETVTKATLTQNGKVELKCKVCSQIGEPEIIYYPKTIKLSKTSYEYTGGTKKPTVIVRDVNGETVDEVNYKVTYPSGRKEVGSYKVSIQFIGDRYSGSLTRTFKIKQASQTIKVTDWKKVLGDTAFDSGVELEKGNGKLTYVTSNKSVATVTSKGKITPKSIGQATITVIASATKNYKDATASFIVVVNPKKMSLSSVVSGTNANMTVKWKKNTTVTGYRIQYAMKSDFSNAKTITVSSKATVTKNISGLTEGKKYFVRIQSYKTVSKLKYYSDWSNYKTVVVVPKKVTLNSVVNKATKKMTVKWTQNAKATGYEIQYSTSSKFTKPKTVAVTNSKTIVKTISNLTKGKRYYVRVRCYKTLSGKKYYSSWSNAKNIIIKK